VTCNAPAGDIPHNADTPYEVPFSLSFGKTDYNAWTQNALTFYYYDNPRLIDVSPKEVRVDERKTVIAATSRNQTIARALIGRELSNDQKVWNVQLSCRFGRFGSTPAKLRSDEKIECSTPDSGVAAHEISEETINFQVAINGYDYTTSPIPFKFNGNKSSNRGVAWVIAILIGSIVIFFLIYLVQKLFASNTGPPINPGVQGNPGNNFQDHNSGESRNMPARDSRAQVNSAIPQQRISGYPANHANQNPRPSNNPYWDQYYPQ